MSEWFELYGFAPVADGLWAGAYPTDADDVAAVAALGVDHVLNLCEDDEYAPGQREVVAGELAAAGVEETRVCLIDYGELPVAELDRAVATVAGWLDAGETAYLHCRAGWQRSAAVAAGIIAVREGVGIDEALGRLAERKPTADPLPHQRQGLRDWWAARCR